MQLDVDASQGRFTVFRVTHRFVKDRKLETISRTSQGELNGCTAVTGELNLVGGKEATGRQRAQQYFLCP